MLTLTTDTSTTFTTPVRVALGSGLAVQIPDGPGRASTRWHERADSFIAQLRELYATRGTALEYRWVDRPGEPAGHTATWMEVRIVDDELPAECLLTHPKIAAVLLEALEITLGTHPAVYYKDGQLRACAVDDARVVTGWTGPMDLSAGYCMTLALK